MQHTDTAWRLEGKKILYIEDTETNVTLMRLIVKRLPGVILMDTSTAEIGIPLAMKEHPDLILMDIDLPGISGIEALKVLRKTSETRDIPVVAISATVMPHDMENLKSAGFDGYISKPFNIHEIPASIFNYIK